MGRNRAEEEWKSGQITGREKKGKIFMIHVFYVAMDGNDDWSGTLPSPNNGGTDGPFASLLRARNAIRAMRAESGLPAGGVTVIVGGGEYVLRDPLVFDSEDSGTAEAPIAYVAEAGAMVRLSGGVRITNWRTVDDAAVLARMAPEARKWVLRADLKAHGVSDSGKMETSSNWAHSDPGLEVFFRGRPMTLARYPNEGFLPISSLSVEDGHAIHGIAGSKTGRFRSKDLSWERLRRWSLEANPMLHGYWFWDWADQRMAVKSIDAESGEITLDQTCSHHYGYRAGQWFYAFNMLCELDQPGEWYLDRDADILYFWPPAFDQASAGAQEMPKDGDVIVSLLRDPFTMNAVSHLTLQGLTIEAVRGTAIQIADGESVRIAGCVFRNIGEDAVRVTGGRKHRIADCDIYQTGSGGIYLEGGDRRTLMPGEHEAINNHIHHISRWNPLYKVGIQLKGCGNRAEHNRIHDIPHIAIGFTGNDQTVEFNEIYQAVTGANDAGAIYSSGAHPEDWSMRGHRVRYNFLHHISGFRGKGCSGIYLDDMFSGTAIHGNILYRVARGFLLGGGRDILATNNVFVDCPIAIHLDARALGWAAFTMPDVIAGLKSMPYRDEPWASRYPELVGILDDEPAVPKGNVIARNIFHHCGGNNIEAGAEPELRMTDNLIGEDPGFVDQARLDFRLKDDSPALKLGFEAIPLGQIGLQTSPLRPNLPPVPQIMPL